MRSKITPLAILWVFNILDALLTHRALNSGMFYEGNPVMAWVIGFGWPTLYAVKIGIVTLCATMFYFLWDKHPFTKKAAWFAAIVYLLVVTWNLGVAAYATWWM